MAEVKFTEEELKNIKDLRKTYFEIQQSFGQLEIARLRLEKQIEDLEKVGGGLKNQFSETQEAERSFLKQLTEKYGEGTLDVDSGKFVSKSD